MNTYNGSCHCGAVRYEVDMDLTQAISCNCSLCARRAHLLVFVPATQFRLLSGEDRLTDYQFNKKIIHHVFCSVCGVGSFCKGVNPDGSEMRAINIRCLEDVDLKNVAIHEFDGKNR